MRSLTHLSGEAMKGTNFRVTFISPVLDADVPNVRRISQADGFYAIP